MDHFITLTEYIKITGIVVGASALIVGYWIKEITGVRKSLDEHKADDEKEFYQSQRDNDTSHAQILQELGKVKGNSELSIQELKGDVKSINGKLDNLLEMLKNIIASKSSL